MVQRIFLAIGAAVAAAAFFILPVKGTIVAFLLALFAPLPIMIVTLGFGRLTGIGASALATIAVAGFANPILAGAFALNVGLPAWWLSVDASRNGARWTMPWAAAWSALLGLAIVGLAAWRFGSVDAVIADLSVDFLPRLESVLDRAGLPGGYSAHELAVLALRNAVIFGPAFLVAWSVINLAANLWIAARVTQISDRLPRKWTDVPDALFMPRWSAIAFAAALVLSIVDTPIAIPASVIAAALGAAFALVGLATLHVMTRRSGVRIAVLTLTYVVAVAIFPWPLLLACLFGIAEAVFLLRARLARTTATPKTNGVSSWK